ncbi:UPF0739 protein C1orf74 homolog [Mytilus californianus]|uniref:UPF0739 protein C1orf74 homolog n=1 Tax=Mytilus californianus TaxID=6549 RepID=UPI0022480D63|nr:UPF0739 protein C1orf74 homolog [Mytilus californianus]
MQMMHILSVLQFDDLQIEKCRPKETMASCVLERHIYKAWGSLIDHHLGKKMRHHLTELLHNVTAVDNAIKPSFLLDFGIKASSLHHFVEDLKRTGCVKTILNIYQMGTDLMVINPRCIHLLQQCSNLESLYYLTDVSSGLEKPQSIKQKLLFEELSQSINLLPFSLDNIAIFDLDVTNMNLTTMFGILLGYPFTYWFEKETEDNCLSMIPLRCLKVTRTIHIQKENETQLNSTESFNVFSFSVPEELFDHTAEDHLNQWFSQKKKKDSSLQLSSKTEILPKVAM